ncbi:MAG: hypothetical protein EHM45_25140 [Desulfobacteraceae bacterium]|nr:MAG: hypothetical protein EHM45_25140 [Desulfobacteraceae bacterium]
MTVQCAFCKGLGEALFGLSPEISACRICGGAGVVEVLKPVIPCAFCQATGAYPHTRITCTVCLGKGLVTVDGSSEECLQCQGTGTDMENGLPCLKCGGKGVLPSNSKKEV